MTRATITDINLANKTVLMRVDFNVPLRGGEITNDRRIRAALPSIRTVLDKDAKLVLLSHLGRPNGNGFQEVYSMKPVAERLGELLSQHVTLGPANVIGPELCRSVEAMNSGEILLLENLRFHPGETVADKADHAPNRQLTLEQQDMVDDLAMAIVTLGDTFVNEAFGTCHRSHASMYAVPNLIKAKGGHAVAGFLVEKEIRHLHDALHAPARPFVAILGGAKVFDKMKFITNILPKVDRILVGGAMAYTLLKARGVPVGRSRVERDQLTEVEQILDIAGDKILLPVDHIATDHFSSEAQEAGEPVTVNTMSIPTDLMGLDIGPKTIAEYGNIIASANTVLWNGPMGAFELPEYAAGTESLAYLIAKATDKGAVSIIGGGDSAAAIENMGLNARMTHVSTGGGASMQYLEGSPMPGLEVLEDPTQPCSPRSR